MKKIITKLIIFDLILLLLIHQLPNKKIEAPKEEKDEVITEENQIEETNLIPHELEIVEEQAELSSRSSVESRQEYIAPTTYSQELVEFVKKSEGFKANAYRLSGETYWTIGYGHHGPDVKAEQVISQETGERLLKADLDGACAYVLKHCDYLQLTQSQLDALTSFTFNGGPGMLNQLTKNKTRNIEEIKEHITAYTNSNVKGLVLRRNGELELLNK